MVVGDGGHHRSRSRTSRATATTTQAAAYRETELLVAVARGLTNAEISAELSISLSTTRTHVSHLLASCTPATASS